MLKPLLKDLGCRLNLETHGDETSFELLQLIDNLGEDQKWRDIQSGRT